MREYSSTGRDGNMLTGEILWTGRDGTNQWLMNSRRDGTGPPRFHLDDGLTVPSRPVPCRCDRRYRSVNEHEKPREKWYEPGKVSFRPSSCRRAVLKTLLVH